MLIVAEETFAAYAAGLYAPLECLKAPRTCSSDAPAEAMLFAPIEVKGYTGTFTPGPAATAADLQKAPNVRRGLKGWAYVMTPQAGLAGPQSYCADSTGIVCFASSEKELVATGGKCPKTCAETK
jgi:hypothetical protein